MIKLEDITLIYGAKTPLEKKVLDGFNLTIAEGEFITLVGGNGTGKSSLLKIISGEVAPTSGRIFVDNQDVTGMSVTQRSKFIAHVYQDPRLGTCELLTIEENLALASSRGQRRGLGFALNRKRRHEFSDLVSSLELGLESRLKAPVSTLSGGQRQALSLLMATMQSPKILLLDEHTSALDPKTSKVVMALTNKIVSDKKITTIMITHDTTQMRSSIDLSNPS